MRSFPMFSGSIWKSIYISTLKSLPVHMLMIMKQVGNGRYLHLMFPWLGMLLWFTRLSESSLVKRVISALECFTNWKHCTGYYLNKSWWCLPSRWNIYSVGSQCPILCWEKIPFNRQCTGCYWLNRCVATRNTQTGEETTTTFDGVIVAIGHHADPHLPLQSFQGTLGFCVSWWPFHSVEVWFQFPWHLSG